MKTSSSKKLFLTVLIACLTLTMFAETCPAQGIRPTPTLRTMPSRPQTDYFAARRTQFIEQMEPGSIAILAARTTPEGAGVADHKFKQDLSFYYLTGSEMPDALCLIVPGAIDTEIWDKEGIIYSDVAPGTVLKARHQNPWLDEIASR